MSVDRSELVAARTIGVGIGFIVLMVGWLVGNRVVGLMYGPPVGPIIALAGAIAMGVATAIVAGRRLSRRVRQGS